MSQGKFWCFTSFELDIDYTTISEDDKIDYLIIGEEICPDTGNIHHQGYVEFCQNMRIKALQKTFGTDKIHWEKRMGSASQARNYCMKDKKYQEWGEFKERNPGKRTDLDEVRNMAKEGKNLKEIAEVCSSYQGIRMAPTLIQLFGKKRNWMPNVYWFWGPTGSGKTRAAVELAGEDMWMSSGVKWFDGYFGQENVILDDFRKDFMRFPELLRLLDRYEFRVEIKGGSVPMLAKNIWITAPVHPTEMFNNQDDDVEQLIRRIKEIKYFGMGDGMKVRGNTTEKETFSDPDPASQISQNLLKSIKLI